MFIDRSAGGALKKWLLKHSNELPNERGDALLSPWRTLILGDLSPNDSVLDKARELLVQNTDQAVVELRAEAWPKLWNISQADWRGFALNALNSGLAYGPMTASFHPKSHRGRALAELTDQLLAPLSGATFLSNSEPMKFLAGENGDRSGSAGSNPVSRHTFDALLIAHDSSRLVIVFIVDED